MSAQTYPAGSVSRPHAAGTRWRNRLKSVSPARVLAIAFLALALAGLLGSPSASAASSMTSYSDLPPVAVAAATSHQPDSLAHPAAGPLNKKAYLPIIQAPARSHQPQRLFLKGVGDTFGNCQDSVAVGAAWLYNWSPRPPDCSAAGIESVPMIWGAADANAVANGKAALGGNSQYLMGFNEPDQHSQANLSPADAAVLWHDKIEPVAAGKKLVGPAVTQYDDCGPNPVDPNTGLLYNQDNCPTPRGLWWLYQFHRDYVARYGASPRIDVLPLHGYHWWGELTTGEVAHWFEALVQSRINLAHQWGTPEVWVTEFNANAGALTDPPAQQCAGVGPSSLRTSATVGCYPSLSQAAVTSETGAFIDWLRGQPIVTRYAWFSTRLRGDEPFGCGNLNKADHPPTPLCDRPLIAWGSSRDNPQLTEDGIAYRMR